MTHNYATAQRLVDLQNELDTKTARLASLRADLEREATAAPNRLRTALLKYADGGPTPDVTALNVEAQAAADAIKVIDTLSAELATSFEGRRLQLQREHHAAEEMLGEIEARRARVVKDGEVQVFELDSYLRMAAMAGPTSLADAMAYLATRGHGRVAQQRLDALVAGGHVAPDAIAPKGWAA